MKKLMLLFVASVLVVAGFSFASANLPILRSSSPNSTWVADGVTQYRIDVYGDSNPLSGVPVRGINFRYFLPNVQGYTFNVVNVNYQNPSNDFFAGYGPMMTWHQNNEIGRVISNGAYPINRAGNVAQIWFTVSKTGNGPNVAQASFGISPEIAYTFFCNGLDCANVYPVHPEVVPFNVMTVKHASLTANTRSRA